MLLKQLQDSLERQFLLDTPLQYVVQMMKRRDFEFVTSMEFDTNNEKPKPRRRPAGTKERLTFEPNYAKLVKRQIPSSPIPASEYERRIYSAGQNPTDFWSQLKRVNGKDFQLFWCIEDNVVKEGRRVPPHGALFIAGLHTETLNRKYPSEAKWRDRCGDDYVVKDIIAQCVKDARLAVEHTTVSDVRRGKKYSSLINSAYDLQRRASEPGCLSPYEIKIYYNTKAANDASGSMCSGSNRKLEKKYTTFIHGLSDERYIDSHHT